MFNSPEGISTHRHGGPYDRGSADAYYLRIGSPHFFVEGTYTSPKIEEADMTPDEIAEYWQGYREQIASGDFKDYN